MGVLRSRVGRVAALCTAVYACVVLETMGYKMFQQKLPNGANVPGVEAIGHERAGGGPNNDFGLDFIEASFVWTTAFCEKDSDGDGQTNGQELGDPCCEFEHRKNEKVRWTEGVSHPGDSELKADSALWENVVCGVEEDAQVEAKEEVTEAATVEDKETMETAVQGEVEMQEEKQFTAGAPALHASVMLSAAALIVMVVYVGFMWMKRRSSRNLPIFRQQRG